MRQMLHKQREYRPAPSLETLIFKMGGCNGAVRRITSRWKKPFTANQVKVALHHRYPALVPLRYQIEDILDWLVQTKRLERVDERSFTHFKQRSYPAFPSKNPHNHPQLGFAFK